MACTRIAARLIRSPACASPHRPSCRPWSGTSWSGMSRNMVIPPTSVASPLPLPSLLFPPLLPSPLLPPPSRPVSPSAPVLVPTLAPSLLPPPPQPQFSPPPPFPPPRFPPPRQPSSCQRTRSATASADSNPSCRHSRALCPPPQPAPPT